MAVVAAGDGVAGDGVAGAGVGVADAAGVAGVDDVPEVPAAGAGAGAEAEVAAGVGVVLPAGVEDIIVDGVVAGVEAPGVVLLPAAVPPPAALASCAVARTWAALSPANSMIWSVPGVKPTITSSPPLPSWKVSPPPLPII